MLSQAKILTRSIKRKTLRSKVMLYIMLTFAPWYVLPRHFITPEGRPAFTRHPGLFTSPLTAAAVAKFGAASLFSWIAFNQIKKLPPAGPDAYDMYNHFVSYGAYSFFFLIAFGIYVWAAFEWGFHRVAFHACQRMDLVAHKIPFQYFVLTSAASGLWLALFIHAVAWVMRHSGGNFVAYVHALQAQAMEVQSIAFWAFLGSAYLLQYANRRRAKGISEVYGNSKLIPFLIVATKIALFIMVTFAISYLSSR
ncbi:hypothetical protein PPN31114_02830 [Pandoraea pneumonica]|uniref:Yip1 domain-containing protein n=1 Tax=Pandoraea pneumonica TaxID=2508299 RepID=A0A5E4VQG8_9BURK|nr:hypothetical protein [Pandoraea pneumonica]VVE14582.1 hypothetical protein PPN31114_02830 [Pandoraea pneumonica]